MNNAREFAIELDKEFQNLEEKDIKRLKQYVAMQALKGVTLKMPVKEGRARGNTNASINAIDYTVTDTVDPTGTATINRGSTIINGPQDPYDVIWVANSLPYINRLENGWSKQAPAGMFAVTVAEIQTQFSGPVE